MKTITVIGVGALGSNFLLATRNVKDVRFKVVDFDRVEAKNLMAQLHTKMGVGRNKTEALKQLLDGLFGLKLTAIPYKLTADNIEAILGDADLVIDCTDNIEARSLILAFARRKETPTVHGALSADGMFGRIVWSEHFVPDAEGAPGQATCEDGAALPFFLMASAHLAEIVADFVSTGRRRSIQLTSTSIVRLA